MSGSKRPARGARARLALNTASGQIETLRTRADSEIATTVESLNTGLKQVADLNARIVSAQAADMKPALWRIGARQ